jgi:tRNA pseudouridine55 synthase
VESCLQEFMGEIEQVPPAYSAAKVTGRRAYDLARRGEEVSLAPRRVQIYGIDIRAFAFPRLDLEVHCGKGTYIRALARDLGKKLGCGAYLATLCRTRVGPFSVEAALSLDAPREEARQRLLPLQSALAGMPELTLSDPEIRRLKAGQEVSCDLDFKDIWPDEVAVCDGKGKLVAVCRWRPGKGSVKPEKVLS